MAEVRSESYSTWLSSLKGHAHSSRLSCTHAHAGTTNCSLDLNEKIPYGIMKEKGGDKEGTGRERREVSLLRIHDIHL